MNLLSALDSFLNHFYDSFAPPVSPDCSISAHGFYESVIIPAVQSPQFRENLLKDPQSVLAEIGIVLPEGVEVKFVENTKDVVHIAIPPYIGE
jgi:hypothetical protein